MNTNFINPILSKYNLESYIIQNEILKSLNKALPLFKGEVLDAGCGSMPYKQLILSNKSVTNYIGLDIETEIDYENVIADVLWDGIKMPFNSNTFDVVISTEVLEHIPNPDNYLIEVIRVLKPNGIFFFTVPFLMSLHEVPNDYYRYTPFALEKLFNKNGFVNIQIKPMGGYNASLAHMIGLWVNMYLWGRKKKLMRVIALPTIKYLYKNDKPPKDFNKSTMIVGLSGTVIKPNN